MGNSNSARRNQSRSVPTSPELRLRFRLKSPYYIIITIDNSRRFECFDIFFIYAHVHTILDEVIVNLYFLLLYIGFLDPPYTQAVLRVYRPRSLRDFINCKIHLPPTVSIYLYLPATLNVHLSGTWELLLNCIVI